jgi:RNA recognition motif-containing protein
VASACISRYSRVSPNNKYGIGSQKNYLYYIGFLLSLICFVFSSVLALRLCSSLTKQNMDLYIGNLSKLAMASDLKKLFSEFGEVVSAKVITDRFNGRSRGFAFVSMGNRASGEQAILKLHNLNFMSHTLIVRETTNKESIEQKGGF